VFARLFREGAKSASEQHIYFIPDHKPGVILDIPERITVSLYDSPAYVNLCVKKPDGRAQFRSGEAGKVASAKKATASPHFYFIPSIPVPSFFLAGSSLF
jgi:hypothetical protein